MHHALIIAGGSGTRLWPMSRARLPKQLIPFIGGKSLLQIAIDRLRGLVPDDHIHICAAEAHRELIVPLLGGDEKRFIGEPTGRDTLNAVGLGAAVIGGRDADAVIAVFTADHIIEPIDEFQRIVQHGYAVADADANTLVTFGIAPMHAATGYGYLKLGPPLPSEGEGWGEGQARPCESPGASLAGTAFRVAQFKEKPDAATARQYLDAGPSRYLWNSGMFVWRADTLMRCIEKYVPENHAGLAQLAQAWDTPRRDAVLAEVYPKLKKISVDYAIMEPASRDSAMRVAAVPMPLSWLDVGSWPAFAQTCQCDADGNALAPDPRRHVILDSRNTLAVSSDAHHVIATIGCEDLIIVHTPEATLVCRADRAEDIKKLHAKVGEQLGKELL
ncbi:MAG: mannose-1-phosphate guanylyltransferase [Phycisphaeraceae bacterium]